METGKRDGRITFDVDLITVDSNENEGKYFFVSRNNHKHAINKQATASERTSTFRIVSGQTICHFIAAFWSFRYAVHVYTIYFIR